MTDFAGLDQYTELLEKIDAWEWGQAKRLAMWIRGNLHPKSVIDIGCASGLYLVPFLKVGIEVLGVDGAPTAGSRLSPEQYLRWDLRWPFPLVHKFDLCICLETAEHIEPEYSDTFIQMVASSADIIVFSAAAPGQGGQGHYTLREKSFWLEKFSAYGFSLHALNEKFGYFVATNAHQCFHPWLINNSMILSK
jgi:SAM-dependent methyltransferase